MSGHSWSSGDWAWTDTRSNSSSGNSSYDNRNEAWTSYDLTVVQGGWYSQGDYCGGRTDLGRQPWMGPAFVIGSANHDYHSVRSDAVPQQWQGPHGAYAPYRNHEGWQETTIDVQQRNHVECKRLRDEQRSLAHQMRHDHAKLQAIVTNPNIGSIGLELPPLADLFTSQATHIFCGSTVTDRPSTESEPARRR